MKKYFTLKKLLLALGVVFVVIQFFRIDKTNPAVDPAQDFLSTLKPSAEISGLLKTACYDCHSHETKYPWYTNIAPVSWWIKNHFDEGREELNFSTWQAYTAKKKDHKLKECVELVKEKEMPLTSYTWMHSDARLSDVQRTALADYFSALRSGSAATTDSESESESENGE